MRRRESDGTSQVWFPHRRLLFPLVPISDFTHRRQTVCFSPYPRPETALPFLLPSRRADAIRTNNQTTTVATLTEAGLLGRRNEMPHPPNDSSWKDFICFARLVATLLHRRAGQGPRPEPDRGSFSKSLDLKNRLPGFRTCLPFRLLKNAEVENKKCQTLEFQPL